MEEIKTGQKFLCIKDVIDKDQGGFVYYTLGKIYTSENCDCISDNTGERNHHWDINVFWVMKKFKDHFIRIPRNKRWKNKGES